MSLQVEMESGKCKQLFKMSFIKGNGTSMPWGVWSQKICKVLPYYTAFVCQQFPSCHPLYIQLLYLINRGNTEEMEKGIMAGKSLNYFFSNFKHLIFTNITCAQKIEKTN